MRSMLRPLLAVTFVLSLAACHESHEPEGPRVTVLFTTDEHSHLFAAPPEVDDFDLATGTIKTTTGTGKLEGGIARRATILAAERAAAAARGSEAITFSAGDYSQGALSGAAHLLTAPDLRAMKLLGYDAVAIGNHEFDIGSAGLAASIAAAGSDVPPLVLTNAIFSSESAADDSLAALYGPGQAIAPYRVLALPSGRKVGVVAVMGVGAGTDAASAAPVTFWSATAVDPMAAIISIVQPVVNSLRSEQGASTVIVLGHGGIGPKLTRQGTFEPGDDEKLAMGLSGVDLVVSGHTHSQGVRPVVGADGRYVPVVQVPPFGGAVGRVDLVFDGDRPVLDPEQTAFVGVDDRTAPTADPAITGLLYSTIDTLETVFLPGTLTTILGSPPAHAVRGDLYYRQIGKTSFDIRGLSVASGESNALNLDTDAMLAIVNGLGLPTEVALQNYGSIRTDLPQGETGALSFSDVYRVVPNGADPTVYPPTPGFPLVRLGLWTFALRAALEGTLAYSALDGDYFLGGSGLKVVYDKSRTPWDQNPFSSTGWITSIALVDASGVEKKIYDVTESHDWTIPYPIVDFQPGLTLTTHFVENPMAVRTAVTTYYVAAFAAAFKIPLLTPSGVPITTADLASTVVTWDGSNHVKDHQALGRYVYSLCCPSGGCTADTFVSLPPQYDESAAEGAVPRRIVCTGPLCF